MQIVIDVPEKAYNLISGKINTASIDLYSTLIQAVQTGTPLPKGHGDLIDVNRKITVPIYDDQYEEYGEKTLTVLEVLNRWSDEGITAKDVIIPADKESEEV